MLHPNTCTSENLTSELWDLLDASGYFRLAGRTTQEFVELRRGLVHVAKSSVAHHNTFYQVVWPSDRGVEASVSFMKAYSRAWMGHQLAKRPGKPLKATGPGQILRDIYLDAFGHPQSDPDFDWMVGYVEPTVPWMNEAHLEFARRYESKGLSLVLPTRMMSARCNEFSGVRHDFEIGEASRDELVELSRTIRKNRPACYLEALDFEESKIDLQDISRQWQGASLERGRVVLVARRGGVPIAAAVLESGELGTNMFRLLDSVRLFDFALAEDWRIAFIALFDEARRWYAAKNRTSFLYLREDGDASYAELAKLHDDSEPCLWVISRSILPEFLEHVCELVGKRNVDRKGEDHG